MAMPEGMSDECALAATIHPRRSSGTDGFETEEAVGEARAELQPTPRDCLEAPIPWKMREQNYERDGVSKTRRLSFQDASL
jgi:hypothetical protein